MGVREQPTLEAKRMLLRPLMAKDDLSLRELANVPRIADGGNEEGRMKVRSEKRRVSGGESPPSLEAKPLEFGAKAMDGKV